MTRWGLARWRCALNATEPYLSVIVPAHQAEAVLHECLGALARSDLPREAWELIVVDDASTDRTSLVAARYADIVVRLAGNPHGPAYARNRGCEVSRGEILVFVDADVCVHADALGRFAELFASDPGLSAAFGSYDAEPRAPGLVSQFRNLMHHFVHHRHAGEAETFWAGCGAVRRAALREVGLFDEWHYPRPQIEDIELGRRLHTHGHRIVIRPEIQGTHLKRWTFREGLKTDFRNRGVPWMWLLLSEGSTGTARTLNLRLVDRACTALTGLIVLALPAALMLRSPWPLGVGVLAAAAVVYFNRDFYAFLRRRRGWLFTLGAVPLKLVYYLVSAIAAVAGWMYFTMFGEPSATPDAAAQSDIGFVTWPPGPTRPRLGVWSRPAPAVHDRPEAGHGEDG